MNPFETQRRMGKAAMLADAAEDQWVSAEKFLAEWPRRNKWCEQVGIKPASKETWEMAAELLSAREKHVGLGGLNDPRVVQRLAAMAVRLTETLARGDIASDEVESLSRADRRQAARLAKADNDGLVFDLAQKFMEFREEHRLKEV